MPKEKILVIDDEEIVRVLLDKVLKNWGHEATLTSSGEEALHSFKPGAFELALVDFKMPGLDGIQVLTELKKRDPEIDIIIMTAFGTVESAVEAIKKGALDYVAKPIDMEHLKIVLDRALRGKQLAREVENLKAYTDQRASFGDMIGASPAMKKVYQLIEKIAASEASIFIQGETGTGKELVARAIHQNSQRKDKKFVVLTCSTLPESLLESELFGYQAGAFTGATKSKEGLIKTAHQGTLFLDEIADTSPGIQMKLLRVLQEHEFNRIGSTQPVKVDIRLISATNKNLTEEIKANRFREDLFYRINVITLNLPALRDRQEDIPLLARHFLDRFNASRPIKIKNISLETMILLTQYPWPGNVRELENVIERAVSLDSDGVITPEDLPEHVVKGQSLTKRKTGPDTAMSLKPVMEKTEKDYLVDLLKSLKGNASESARKAGLSHAAFYEKLKKHGINPSDYR